MSGTRSPSQLQPPTRRMPRRLNRLPIVLGMGGVLTAVTVVGYAFIKRSEQTQTTAAEDPATAKKPISGSAPGFLQAPTPVKDVQTESRLPPAKEDTTPPTPVTTPAATSLSSVTEQARAQAWQAYYQQQAQAVSAHNSMEQAARTGSMDPLQNSNSGGSSPLIPGDPTNSPGNPNGDTAPANLTSPFSMGGVNPAGQTGKQAFLRTPGDIGGQNEDLPGSVHGPKPLTVMEGTALPCRLLEGATSDMPGQLNAEIETNVYDSMTGDYLLIPQGTRLVTTYDIAVSAGQDRMGVIGQRIIFPDTSSRQLGSMSLADPSGLAGLSDITDTHFWERFGTALTVSLIGAGAQLSQPQQSAFAAPSSTTAATGAITQQMAQFGQSYAQQGLSIPNTIKLRPGLQCLVKLNKDITLPKYVDKRTVTTEMSLTVGKRVQ